MTSYEPNEATVNLIKALQHFEWKDALLCLCKGADPSYGYVDERFNGERSYSVLTLAIRSNDPIIVDAVLSSVKPPKTAADLCNGGDIILSKESALHYAAKKNSDKVIKTLLMHGAGFGMLDENGKTPLELAKALQRTLGGGRHDMIEILTDLTHKNKSSRNKIDESEELGRSR